VERDPHVEMRRAVALLVTIRDAVALSGATMS
jgi:hypothetical protein